MLLPWQPGSIMVLCSNTCVLGDNLDTILFRIIRQIAHRPSGLAHRDPSFRRRCFSRQFHSRPHCPGDQVQNASSGVYFTSRVIRSVSPCFAILRCSLRRARFVYTVYVAVSHVGQIADRSRSRPSRSSPFHMGCWAGSVECSSNPCRSYNSHPAA